MNANTRSELSYVRPGNTLPQPTANTTDGRDTSAVELRLMSELVAEPVRPD
jgi:hypothetical protein